METIAGDEANDLLRPEAVYRHIESWWGEPFDDKLVERMVNAPWEHQMRFLGTLEFLPAMRPIGELEEIRSGVLRPALCGREFMNDVRPRQVSEGLRLLLYAHEIVLDCSEIFYAFEPYTAISGGTESEAEKDLRTAVLRNWVRLRPLVEDGSIKLTPALGALDIDQHDHVEAIMAAPDLQPLLAKEWREFNSGFADLGRKIGGDKLVWRSLILTHYGGMSSACRLAAKHQAHVLARSSVIRP